MLIHQVGVVRPDRPGSGMSGQVSALACQADWPSAALNQTLQGSLISELHPNDSYYE